MIGIVLVDANSRYRDDDYNLPHRPLFDKELLISVTAGKDILCSPNTLHDLPCSLVRTANRVLEYGEPPTDNTVNLGIRTFDQYPPDKMIVVSSMINPLTNGPVWRMPCYYADYTYVQMQDSILSIYSNLKETP